MHVFDQFGPQAISHAHLHNVCQQRYQSYDLNNMTRGVAHHVKAYTQSNHLQGKASRAYD